MAFTIYRNSQIVNLTVTRFGQTGPQGEQGETGATGATGATGPAGPAPSGTGLVSVTGGALDTPETLAVKLAADAANLRTALVVPTGSGTSTGTNTGDQDLSGLVPNTRTVNGHALSGNVTVTKSDVGLGNADNTSDANKPVSTAQQTAINNQTAIPKNADFIFEGDSITAGYLAYTPFPTLLSTMSNFANRGTISNVAVSGSQLNSGGNQIASRYAGTVKPLIDASIAASKIPYLFILIGSNDIASGTVTTANVNTWFTALESYASTAQTDGARVVVMTVLPRAANMNLVVNAINGRIRSSTVFDGCIDTSIVHNDPFSTRFTDADGTHLNTAGNERIADYINQEMSHLGRGKFQSRVVQDGVTRAYAGPTTAAPEGTAYTIERSIGFVIGTTEPGTYSALNLIGTTPGTVIRYSLTTGAQQTSGFTGIAPSGGSVIAGSTGGDMIIGAPSGNGIGFGTNTSGNTQTLRVRISDAGGVSLPKTITAAATTGAQTINNMTGSVNFAAAATSLVVTNSLVTANSVIHCTVGTNDSTMKGAVAVAGSGSFTIYADADPTAETRVNFTVTN